MPKAFEPLAGPPLFITGQGRSGTSWTLDLFGRQPEVCAVFETWLLTQTRGLTAVLTQPHWHPGNRAKRFMERAGEAVAALVGRDDEVAVLAAHSHRSEEDKAAFLPKYLEMLSLGGSKKPEAFPTATTFPTQPRS